MAQQSDPRTTAKTKPEPQKTHRSHETKAEAKSPPKPAPKKVYADWAMI